MPVGTRTGLRTENTESPGEVFERLECESARVPRRFRSRTHTQTDHSSGNSNCAFTSCRFPKSLSSVLKNWTRTALLSRLEPLRKFVGTLRRNQHRILTFIKCPITNAVAEGLNRMIRQIRNRASGYRNVECFKDVIYLTLGDLDLPGEIPNDHQLEWM